MPTKILGNMPVPAQFQIGLELTNIVNPLSQALSSLGSLALVDAIKKAGSDAITEMKLASLIGRHRIDEVMKWHFRERVAQSDKNIISRYVDIVLESGAGPTVQEALKNPALFSMVVQLSVLAFAHEDESLANGIVEAIEIIVKDSGRDMEIVPDYVSLLGTIRACQQQTAAFRWTPLFEDVEWKIEKIVGEGVRRTPRSQSHESKRQKIGGVPFESLSTPMTRAIPFPVLQSLIMWLQSLQSFPEHRILHLKCHRGISTVVVWCHHVLGLTVSIKIWDIEFTFGQGNANILIEGGDFQHSEASLMDPNEPNEPLFNLTKDANSSGVYYERRAEFFGYGLKVLKNAVADTKDIEYCVHWMISQCVPIIDRDKMTRHCHATISSNEMDLQAQHQRLLKAGQFLFAMDNIDSDVLVNLRGEPFKAQYSDKVDTLVLMAVLIALSHVEADDLEHCRELPLSLIEYERIRHSQHHIDSLDLKNKVLKYDPRNSELWSVLDGFAIISRLMLGHMYSEEYLDRAVLISAWGWSVFFECMDSTDPTEVSVDRIRIVCGVPTRRGMRRARIIDGPTGSQGSFSAIETRIGAVQLRFFPGISTARFHNILVGYHSDAFQVAQQITWRSSGAEERNFRLAFRQRLTQRIYNGDILKPSACTHTSDPQDAIAWIDRRLRSSTDTIKSGRWEPNAKFYIPQWPKNINDDYDLPERVFGLSKRSPNNIDSLCLYAAHNNPAARWLLMDNFHNSGGRRHLRFLIRDRNTCIKCAIDALMVKKDERLCVVLL